MFQTQLSIKMVLDGINRNYFLPAIQREFVWKEEQILDLIDSILRGYPFGSFLVWRVKGANIKKFEFYKFIQNYHQKLNCHNEKATLNTTPVIDAILDGQQRLTSLYIALNGSYATKIPYRRREDPAAFPSKKLFLNLLNKNDENDDIDRCYILEFKDPKEVENQVEWFEIGKILSMQITDVLRHIKDNGMPDLSLSILSNLFQRVNDPTFNYYLEESDELHKVLNIFVRVNSGGTILSYSDLLLSIATAGIDKFDARNEIHSVVDEINEIGNGFNINKDFILKTCLFILDRDVKFSIDNFDIETMKLIETTWENMKQAISGGFQIAQALGFCSSNLSSNYPISVIAYYLYKCQILAKDIIHKIQYQSDLKEIQRFISISLFKQVFAGSLDTVLTNLRKAFTNPQSFSIVAINDQMPMNKKFEITDEDIDQLLEIEYGHRFAFMLLALIYPNKDLKNIFHVDHIFPKSKFKQKTLTKLGISEEKIPEYIRRVNVLSNLQLLEGPINLEKLDAMPEDWIREKYRTTEAIESYKRENYMNLGKPLDIDKFLEFEDERRELIKGALKEFFKQ
jgi:uncharacterized protein with ParB-like and HNH nuclease domain